MSLGALFNAKRWRKRRRDYYFIHERYETNYEVMDNEHPPTLPFTEEQLDLIVDAECSRARAALHTFLCRPFQFIKENSVLVITISTVVAAVYSVMTFYKSV